MAGIGFVLSPLSWRNDPLVNIPLALGAAWLVAQVWPALFSIAFVAAYWLTNVAGLVLLHKGTLRLFGVDERLDASRLTKDLLISVAYTGIVVVLIRAGVLAGMGLADVQ